MAKTPYAQQRDARRQNVSALLRDLWSNAPLSKAALAQRNGLTKATVSAICAELVAFDLICDVGQDKSGIGRPSNLLELNESARAAIGLEISTNYVAILLTDLRARTLWRRAIPTSPGSSQAMVLALADDLIDAAMGEAKTRELPLLGIGVGLPGAVDPTQASVLNSPALGWRNVALRDLWQARFSQPVVVENRARAAAVAEGMLGAAQGVANFIYVSLGTDVRASIDAALVVDGALYHGAHGLGVDAGHLVIDPHGDLCSCGQHGCWQAMADVGREVDLARPRLQAGEPSLLQEFAADAYATLDHRAIHQAAVQRDPLALEIVREVLVNNIYGVANLITVLDPELVVIGYANSALPSAYLARMEALSALPEIDVAEGVRRQLARRGFPPPPLRFAAYGADACALGAATLLLDEFLRNPPIYDS